jgi:hypothetical protein
MLAMPPMAFAENQSPPPVTAVMAVNAVATFFAGPGRLLKAFTRLSAPCTSPRSIPWEPSPDPISAVSSDPFSFSRSPERLSSLRAAVSAAKPWSLTLFVQSVIPLEPWL